MKNLPKISIVVPSYNQVQYLPETLQSLVDQDYPKLEVIIQDGVSKDGSIEVAKEYTKRYPEIFKLYVEKDNGQADGLNRGFSRVTGEIFAFLNSDDTYYKGTLHRVAAEINPTLERYIVMGRCLFTGENSPYVGVEHPAEYKSHFDHLAIWNRGFNTIPQPSVFWHRQVWLRCGGLDVNEQHALDYDLFCRFSRYYRFHRIDELFSTYRMHDASKSSQRTESEVLELSIGVSRKHWGSWLRPLRWRCEISYWLYKQQRHEQARHHARRASEAFSAGKHFTAFGHLLTTFVAAPKMGRNRLIFALMNEKGMKLLEKYTTINEGFISKHADGWIGPIYRENIAIPYYADKIVIIINYISQANYKDPKTILSINEKVVQEKYFYETCTYGFEVNVRQYEKQAIQIELKCNFFFIPSEVHGGGDTRQLSVQIANIEFRNNANEVI
jgi:glycosyltransferase involved in cell wall biosynthesis